LLWLSLGLDWLVRGKVVLIISLEYESAAISNLLYNQLRQLAGPAAANLHLHLFHTNLKIDVATVVATLMSTAQNGELFIIADEVVKKYVDYVDC
jgi:hypothetical protein